MWRNKVNPVLLQQFDEASMNKDRQVRRVVLEYRGNFNRLQLDVEVLSALDDQLQIVVPLSDLPALAAIDEISTIGLPGSSWSYKEGVNLY